ncbi:LysR substrate-binding domain-containing protein [Pseudomonas sp. L1(2025)]|uniref:LysR substrate-binding domain-containing protein n=1 Tax=Pseudomonas sp. L1(2025) TaxID=3449429 RepID=UPI003F68BB32
MKTPPLNAVKAFEAVSRHLSVTKAAAELCVTQGAASQQIKNLENYVNCPLFIRDAKGLTLTKAGQRLAGVAQKALGELAAVAEEIIGTQRTTLSISAPPSFAVKWLIPNLNKFYETHTDLNIIIDASCEVRSFRNDGIDASIRFGKGEHLSLNSKVLGCSDIIIVASPAYIRNAPAINASADLYGHKLISYESKTESHRKLHKSWQGVFSELGLLLSPSKASVVFTEGHMALTAAIHGQGLALIESILVDHELRSGQLEKVLDSSFSGDNCYTLFKPEYSQKTQALQKFEDWLVDSLACSLSSV